MRGLLLGLDVGSTVIKAVAFDRTGRMLASAARRVPVRSLRPGWMERDPQETWRASAAVLRAVTVGRALPIAALSVTGCGNGAVFLDGRHHPLRAGILSSDTRAVEFLGHDRRRTRQEPYAGQTSALLRWFRANEPRVAARLGHVVFWKDWVRLRLTGESCTDFTDAGASGLLDVGTRRWLADDPAQPPIQPSFAAAGAVTAAAAAATGLREGTPVFAGCIDCEAAAIGSGVTRPGELSLVAGTWSINQTFSDVLPAAGEVFLCNPSTQPKRWLLVEGSPTSAANFDWAVQALGLQRNFSRATALAEAAPPAELIFLPRVPTGAGSFAGLGLQHSQGGLLRAVMQGVAFAHRWHVEKLERHTGRLRTIRLSGGAARSRFWCQLFADTLGRPVEVPALAEVGAWGAALCAGVGLGFWPSLLAAQRACGRIGRRYRSRNREHERLNRTFERFSRHFKIP